MIPHIFVCGNCEEGDCSGCLGCFCPNCSGKSRFDENTETFVVVDECAAPDCRAPWSIDSGWTCSCSARLCYEHRPQDAGWDGDTPLTRCLICDTTTSDQAGAICPQPPAVFVQFAATDVHPVSELVINTEGEVIALKVSGTWDPEQRQPVLLTGDPSTSSMRPVTLPPYKARPRAWLKDLGIKHCGETPKVMGGGSSWVFWCRRCGSVTTDLWIRNTPTDRSFWKDPEVTS